MLWLDLETYSEADLLSVGTHAYAEHPSTEIVVAQWAIDDGEPVVEDLTGRRNCSFQLAAWLERSRCAIDAHNSVFDRTILRNVWNLDIPVERWRDTMVKALLHGLPGGLDKLSTILQLGHDEAKDKRGKELIRLFCKPQKRRGGATYRATRETHPAEWAEFLAYSRQDIIAMRAVDQKLPNWNYRDDSPELTLWHLDQRANDRGFAVDVELAAAAVRAVDVEQARLKQAAHDATGGEVTALSKRDQLLVHILMEYGVTLPDMKADTLRRRIEDPELPEGVRLLLSLRLEATKTSTAKYKTAGRAVSRDGRLRNTQQFSGAQRTGRVAHRLFQGGNMPRPDLALIERETGISFKGLDDDAIDAVCVEYYTNGVEALKAGCAPLLFGDVMGLTANLVRGVIIAPPMRKLVIADLANIEGRGLAYIAGEGWKIEAFRRYDAGTGPDLYRLAYARAFNCDPKDATGMRRQIGKVMELGLGYEGGVAAFLTFAAVYKMDLDSMADAVHQTAPKDVLAAAYRMWEWAEKKGRTIGLSRSVYVACEALKSMWRAAHPATSALWEDMQQAVVRAIRNPETTIDVGQLRIRRDGAWLRIRLPSGRYLCYLKPDVSEGGQVTYWGVDQYTKRWKAIKSYGGKFVENIVQAWARDVLFYRTPDVEAEGYGIVLSVHDELLTETPDTPEFSSDHLADIMTREHSWAVGCPLAAAGFETKRYRK